MWHYDKFEADTGEHDEAEHNEFPTGKGK